jgi:hypothetical protein
LKYAWERLEKHMVLVRKSEVIKPLGCRWIDNINPLNAELNPIRHMLALVGARHIVHISRIRVKMSIKVDFTAVKSGTW